MRWHHKGRFAPLAAILLVATFSGCPELNYWQGPSQDPFFSVADPLAPQSSAGSGLNAGIPVPIAQPAATSAAR